MPHWFGEERVFLPPEQNASIASVGGSAMTTCRLSPMAPAMLTGSTSTLASLPDKDRRSRSSRSETQPLPGAMSNRAGSSNNSDSFLSGGVQPPGSGGGGADRRAASFSGDNTPPSADITPPPSAKPPRRAEVVIPIDADSSITERSSKGGGSSQTSLASGAGPFSFSSKAVQRPRDESSSEDEMAPPKKQYFMGKGADMKDSRSEKDDKKRRKEKEQRKLEREEGERLRLAEEAKAARKAEKGQNRPMRFKVDPKTLFANERTMLQWLNSARTQRVPPRSLPRSRPASTF